MKIIQVCPRYSPQIGGVETHVKELSRGLVEKGFEVEIYCADSQNKKLSVEFIEGVKVFRCRSFAPNDSYYFSPILYDILKKSKYDVMHAHSYHAFPLLIGALAKRKGKPLVTTFHYYGRGYSTFRSMLHAPYIVFGHYIVNSTKRIVCVSKNEKKIIENKFPFASEKTIHIPNGVNYERFANSRPILDEDGFKILYVGRLSPEKNLQTLFLAYKELQEKIENTKLIIVGSGPSLFYLKKLSEHLSLRNLIWTSGISHELIASYYKSADVFVLSSDKEVQCISVLEAMASGLPVVLPYYDGVKDIVFNGETGLFFKNNNYHDLTEKLMRMNYDENLRKKMSKEAQKNIKNNFDWKILIPKYIELFHEVMANE
jgi:1,2-diacylglycerol 3-alpha-glucosyltransferase